jgi:hypothetical protein
MRLIITIVLLSFSFAGAKTFQNSYVQFELPDRWECKLEGTEWVCSSLKKDESKEAIFVLTAKEVGPSDTLEAYEAHLRQPKSIPNASGKPVQSQVKSLERRQINGHVWVDSLHLGSEIPQYYTRYLATTKDRLAILVTFSAHQLHFTKYSADILRAVQSLVVKAQFSLGNSAPSAAVGGKGEIIGGPVGMPTGDFNTDELPREPSGRGPGKLIALFILIAAVGAYLFLKKRKKEDPGP